MKKLMIFLLSGLAFVPVVAQQKISTASYKLHGPVKVLRERDADIKPDGDTSLMVDDEIFFDRAGKIQRIVHHHVFSLSAEDYRYDANGRLQSIEQYAINEKLYLTRSYTYTGDDSTYIVTATLPTGRVYEKESFNHGKKISFERYDKDSSKSDWSTLIYDRLGRLTSDVEFYHKKPSYSNVYQYKSKGMDNVDSFYDKDGKPGFSSEKHYDAQGHIVHTISHMANGKFLRETFNAYDNHGNEINEHEVDGIMNLNWDSKYEYDQHGNWTKRRMVCTTGKHPEPLFIREISYY